MGISRGKEKEKKKESNNNKEDKRSIMLYALYYKYVCKILLPNPNTECIHTIHTL
jgi:hypothetical protein